jgi:hypothetical protein
MAQDDAESDDDGDNQQPVAAPPSKLRQFIKTVAPWAGLGGAAAWRSAYMTEPSAMTDYPSTWPGWIAVAFLHQLDRATPAFANKCKYSVAKLQINPPHLFLHACVYVFAKMFIDATSVMYQVANLPKFYYDDKNWLATFLIGALNSTESSGLTTSADRICKMQSHAVVPATGKSWKTFSGLVVTCWGGERVIDLITGILLLIVGLGTWWHNQPRVAHVSIDPWVNECFKKCERGKLSADQAEDRIRMMRENCYTACIMSSREGRFDVKSTVNGPPTRLKTTLTALTFNSIEYSLTDVPLSQWLCENLDAFPGPLPGPRAKIPIGMQTFVLADFFETQDSTQQFVMKRLFRQLMSSDDKILCPGEMIYDVAPTGDSLPVFLYGAAAGIARNVADGVYYGAAQLAGAANKRGRSPRAKPKAPENIPRDHSFELRVCVRVWLEWAEARHTVLQKIKDGIKKRGLDLEPGMFYHAITEQEVVKVKEIETAHTKLEADRLSKADADEIQRQKDELNERKETLHFELTAEKIKYQRLVNEEKEKKNAKGDDAE